MRIGPDRVDPMVFSEARERPTVVRSLAKSYAALILFLLSVTPALAIAYLHFFQDPSLRFKDFLFHEVAIGIALLQSGFIAYVTWRCYCRSGEPFLRWLTLGFLGFTIVYAMHGGLTRLADENLLLFVIFGPASRLIIAGCLLAGLIAYGSREETEVQRGRVYWAKWVVGFLLADAAIALLGSSAWAAPSRWIMEIGAMGIMFVCAAIIIVRRLRSPLMTLYAIALVFFVQSSLAFLLGAAWDHMWWFAHTVFAAGFMIVSYGVIQAFLTSGSFATVYSQVELMEKIREEKARTEDALVSLQRAHEELEALAATDALTGASNRREFQRRATVELARSSRSGSPVSLVIVDLDQFKQINDRYGHLAGDEILRAFVARVRTTLRPSDVLGRIGGEEFGLLLPETDGDAAGKFAERLRRRIETEVVDVDGHSISFTASFGVAQFGVDGDDYESVLGAADDRMYRAKAEGRNRVAVG